MLNAGFKTGDKIISRWAVNANMTMTPHENQSWRKTVIYQKRNGSQQEIQMPIDFIDQLSKFIKKYP
jgi:regulator of sigma E protease